MCTCRAVAAPWNIVVTLLLVALAACQMPVDVQAPYQTTMTFCAITLGASGPAECAPETCTVTPRPDGSTEYDCDRHHFIIEADGSTSWIGP